MANWSGTYTITSGATGLATSATSTTFTNTLATWPTGAQSLANFTVRILSGTGAGQTRVITSNTATVLTVPAWTTIPDATSAYEIVLIFNVAGSDHVTAALTLSTNIITEITDSTTILFDGLFTPTFTTSCIVRWNKSVSTMCMLEANNRTVQGKAGFWGSVTFGANMSTAPMYSYIKHRDCTSTLIIPAAQTASNFFTGIHHIWSENMTASIVSTTTGAQSQDMVIKNIYTKGNRGATVTFNGTNSPGFVQRYENIWSEWAFTGSTTWNANGPDRKTIRNSVYKHSLDSSGGNNLVAGKTIRFYDNYGLSDGADSITINPISGVASDGTVDIFNNTMSSDRIINVGAGVITNIAFTSKFNDYIAVRMAHANNLINNVGTVTGSLTSNNDYIAGKLLASPENIDTTAATTSTANPVQYLGLTSARTSPKSVRNRPLTIDNVVVGTPTDNQVTITFDCANGAPASATVNVDSLIGQPVLSVTATSDFMVGEVLEIGYGTARAETARILSISAGVSVTFETNLTFTHTAAQADSVKKRLRQWALPRILYGTTSGVYTMATSLPVISDWGAFYTGMATTYKGVTYIWNQTGHSITLYNLKPGQTYYFQAVGYNPFEERLEAAAESTFTTSLAGFSDPGISNVRLATGYTFNNIPLVGNARIPAVGDVKTGYAYDTLDSLTGTYDGSDRWSDPGIANVRLGTAYKANSTVNNRTGNVRLPPASNVLYGYAYDTLDSVIGTLADDSPTANVGARTIFPHLDLENDIQLNDKTRLDVSKSFSIPSATEFTYLAVRPGADEIRIDVYDTDKKKRYLDWEFLEFKHDVDTSNNKIDFNENGVDLAGTLTVGTYDKSSLAIELASAMNAVGSNTYTCSFDEADQLTISSTGDFDLIVNGVNRFNQTHLVNYFDPDFLTGATSYESTRVDHFERKVSVYAGEDKYNVQKITCVANIADALNSKYFYLSDAGNVNQYYVWFNSSGMGIDPVVPDYVGVEIVISTGDTASTVATALNTAISALVGFTVSQATNILTLTNVDFGWCTPAYDGTVTGQTYQTVVEGQKQLSDYVFVNVYSKLGDYLFSNDADLMQFEPDIRKWVGDGRNTFLNVHRQAQSHILEYLDRQGFINNDGKKFTKFDFLDLTEVKEWSRFVALRMIFEGIKNSQDEVFLAKRQTYEDKETAARNRMVLRLRKNSSATSNSNINLNHSVGLGRS